MDAWSEASTVALLLVPTFALTLGLVLFVRLWASGRLRDGLAYLVYLHGRRSRFVALFVAMTSSYVGAGGGGTLAAAGSVGASLTNSLSAGLFFVGSIALLLVLWWGLQPHPTNAEEHGVLLKGIDAHRTYVLGVVDRAESER